LLLLPGRHLWPRTNSFAIVVSSCALVRCDSVTPNFELGGCAFLVLDMGDVRDLFRSMAGASYCEMLVNGHSLPHFPARAFSVAAWPVDSPPGGLPHHRPQQVQVQVQMNRVGSTIFGSYRPEEL
jgi:hypothetical protein